MKLATGIVNRNFQGPSQPLPEILSLGAPLSIWDRAKKEAKRSPMIKFKVGAVIWEPSTNSILSSGTSHPDITLSRVAGSIHAEHHALIRAQHLVLEGTWCVVFTLNGKGGCTYTSRPCHSCTKMLVDKGIERVVYSERTEDGKWIISTESPSDMLRRSPHTQQQRFARKMRIPSHC